MNKTLSRVGIFIVGVVAVAAGGFAYGITPTTVVEYVHTFENPPKQIESPHESGSFVMTLRPLVPVGSNSGVYRLDAVTSKLQKIYDGASSFAPSLSPDEQLGAIVANNGSQASQLYIIPIQHPYDAKIITPPRPTIFAGASAWSHDGSAVAYEALTALPNEVDNDMANSRVVFLSLDTSAQTIVDTGMSPVFAPDGSLYYLKNDGVYHVTHTDTSFGVPERVVFIADHLLDRTARIAITHNGDMLALTEPATNVLTLWKIDTNASAPVLSQAQQFSGAFFWPVFSPDSSRLATVEYYKDSDKNVHKTLAILDLATGKAHSILSLDGYTDDLVALGAWIK